ncbi:uncharacterized protein LOC142591113 [Dermacentor variabilis]|uniref:uncharacterized protein LOC142591113 n=1 Tax=Dermacentor variabilis TaxID=34621 RepID=UPI003F5BE115
MKLVPLLLVSFLSLGKHQVTVMGQHSSTKQQPDFETAFAPNTTYVMGFQNFHLEQNERHLWCASFWRENITNGSKLHVEYAYNGTTQDGTADMVFFSTTNSTARNAANVSNAAPPQFEVLNTAGDPYLLLFANQTDCMVVRVPQNKTKGVAKEHGNKDGAKGHCVILYRYDLHNDRALQFSCLQYYVVNCNPWLSHRVNNTQCLKTTTKSSSI